MIGEVLAGILLGPSLLGRIAPGVGAFVLPDAITPALTLIAQVGVVLYMFIVGLELNLDRARSRAHATVAISHASIVLLFVLGTTLALFLYPRFSTSDVPFTSFALFIGVAMSITAFPVLMQLIVLMALATTMATTPILDLLHEGTEMAEVTGSHGAAKSRRKTEKTV